jgi:hypothetical protein
MLICLNSIFSKSWSVSPPLLLRWPTPITWSRQRPAKNANFNVLSASRVAFLPQQEPLSFKDVNRYLIWYNAMQEEIWALYFN